MAAMKTPFASMVLLAALPLCCPLMFAQAAGVKASAPEPAAAATFTPDPNERLGTVNFPVSCAPASQAAFNRGVALLHDFWYQEAEAQYKRLIASDPQCAMAHWGLAMSSFHQIWGRPSASAMTSGWTEMQKAQALSAGTPIEKAYIAALSDFFRPGPSQYPARITAYSDAMGKLYAANPGNVDAGAFYALSILAAKAITDDTYGPEHKAMAVLNPLFVSNPDNPGVDHYITHACDNPEMAAEGLAAADHYGEIAQSGPHAFHMPGHIYSRLGLWQKDIDSQRGSIAASEGATKYGESGIMDEPHSYDFLLYAYLQAGQDEAARDTLKHSGDPLDMINSMPEMSKGHMAGMIPYYRAKLPIFYGLENRDWTSVAAMEPFAGSPPEIAAQTYWARAEAHGHLHQTVEAKADLAKFDAMLDEIRHSDRAYLAEGSEVTLQRDEVAGWAAFAANQETEALKSMRAAADIQDKVGQGEVDIPAREMLADMLLEFHHPREALAEYEVALKLSPNRFNGLYNAGQAAEMAGDKAKATFYYAALLKSTHNGDQSKRPEIAHAKSELSSTQSASAGETQ
jgi:hypothetical protein